MFKYKKTALIICTLLFLILSFIELIKYLFIDTNIYGLIYLINNLLIIFLLIPTTYNYKRRFSKIRISKFIMIILFGILNSFVLEHIVLSNYDVIDSSKKYIESIFFIKNILKSIIYVVLLFITILEFKGKVLVKNNS